MYRNQGGAAAAPAPLPIDKVGDKAFEQMPKVSSEFFAISYGALVRHVLISSEDNIDAVNHQLEDIGVRIGLRLIEEYVARSAAPPCRTFASTADAIAKVGLKMFLGISAQVTNLTIASSSNPNAGGGAPAAGPSSSSAGSNNESSYSLVFIDNPLNFFVELPHAMVSSLWYSNVLCGVIRGALEQVGMLTEVVYVKDVLRGDAVNEIKVTLKNTATESFKTT